MKDALKDIGGIALDIIITIFAAIIGINIIGSILISTAMGAEALAPRVQDLTEEQKIVAMTILGEARGEGEEGMYAVACVIAQRSIAWKRTPKQICLSDRQFSCWNPKDPNRKIVWRLLNTDSKSSKYARRLAVHLLHLDRSYVSNADHYATVGTDNYWTRKRKPVKHIGNHFFYKLRP